MNVKQVYDLLKKDIRHRIRQTSKDLSDWEPQEDIVTFGTGLAWLDNGQKTPGTGGIKTFLTGRNGLTYDFIDLDQYYTKDETDKLLDDEKKAREEADQDLADWAKESFVYSISASGESPLTLETTDGTNSDGYKTYSITGSVNCYSKEEIDAMLDNLEDKILEEIPSEVVSSVIAESGSDILVADSPEKATSGDVTVKYSVDEEALKKWLEDNGFDPGSVNTGVTSIKITSKTLEVTPEESQTGDVSINLEYTGGGEGGAVDSVLIQHLTDDTTEILTIDPTTEQTGNVVFNLGIDEDALKKYISETSIDLKYYSENTVGNTHAYPSAQINCDGGVNSVLFQILANPTDSSSTYLLATATSSSSSKTIKLDPTAFYYDGCEVATLCWVEDKLEESIAGVSSVQIAHISSDNTGILAISPETSQSGAVKVDLGVDEDSLNAWLKTNGYGQGTTFKYYEEGNNSAYVGGCGDDDTSYGRLEVDLYGNVYLETGKSNAWEHRFALDSSGDLTLRHGQGIDSIVYSVFTEENVTAGTNITISKTPEGKFNISATGDVTPYEYYTEDTIDKLAFIKVDDSLVYVNSQGVSVTAPKFTYGGCEVATQCWVESNYYNKQEIDELLAAIQGGESIAPCTWIGYGNNDPSSTGGTIERSQLMPNSGTPHAGDAILYFHSNYSDNTKITIATVSSVDGDDVSYSYVTSFDINASSSTSSYKLYSETTSAATIETPDVNYGTISTTWSGGTSNIMTTTCLYNGIILSLVVISLRGIEVDGDIKVDGYSVLTEADCTKTMLANMISEYEYNNSTSTVINSSASRVTIMEVVGTGQAVNFTMSATSIQAPVSIGRERYIIIHNTGTGTYTYNFNAVSSYHLICTDGNTSLTIQPGEYGEISVISDGTNLYIRSASQS